MDKKVLLVKCLTPQNRDVYAFRQIPLGLAYLASAIKNRCDLRIFDMRVDDGLLETIRQFQPNVIGLSIFSVDFIYAEKLVGIIKQLLPHSLIVCGGAHPTVEPVETLRTGTNLIIRGEGEYAMQAIVDELHSGHLEYGRIPAASYFDPNCIGGVRHNPDAYKQNIDAFPMPAMEAFDLSKYDQYPLMTSRGCPYGCKFCASKTIWGQRVRFHTAERIFQEITRAVEIYGFKHLVVIDDTFTLRHDRLTDLCDRIIASGYDINWSVNSRTDTITEAVAGKMSQAGCRVVSFGVETGSELIQAAVEKRLDREQMKRAVDACRKAGIRVKTGWMIGLPGNYAEQMKSLDLMLELEPDEISIHHFIPIPGTPYWHQPEMYGLHFDKRTLLNNFSIDALPSQVGLSFSYISDAEIEAVVQEMIRRLRQAGYKRPNELSDYDLKTKVVNTYLDRGRLPVLPAQK